MTLKVIHLLARKRKDFNVTLKRLLLIFKIKMTRHLKNPKKIVNEGDHQRK